MKSDNKTCCIVIPIYKEFPDDFEIASLNQCLKILNHYFIYFVAPQSLNMNVYENIIKSKDSIVYEILRFDDFYFKSVKGYNKLLLSIEFYKGFSLFKYLLIYQLDAWVFKDDLIKWCNKGFDYVGAPWVDWFWCSFYARHITFTRRMLYRLGYRNFNLVGNGGLSLRKIKSCLFNLKFFSKAISDFELNEDFFFSFYINSYNIFFKVAPYKQALNFSFDEHPEKLFKINNDKLPMGCHAWPKYLDFWKPYINIIKQK